MYDRHHLDYVGRLYDLGLNGDSWYDTLTEFCGFVGAGSCSLQIVDPIHEDAFMTRFGGRLTEHTMREYNARFAKMDADALAVLLEDNRRHFLHDFEALGLVGIDRIENHPPLRWCNENIGVFWRVASRLNTSGAWLDVISVQFPRAHGPMSEAEKAFAMPFLPHFAKVVELRRAFSVLEARFRAVLDALDRFNVGVFITFGSGALAVVNREGERILDLRDGLTRDAGGLLTTKDEGVRSRLLAAIAGTAATATGEEDRAEVLLDVVRPSGAPPFLLTVSPLRDDRDRVDRRFRGALIFAIDPENRRTLSTAGIAKVFGLTRAEAAVLALMLDGIATEEIGERRNTSPGTVRNQVKAIFQKTHTHSRADLIRLAVSVDLPIEEA